MSARPMPSDHAHETWPSAGVAAGEAGALWLLIDSSGVGGAESHVAQLAASLRQRGIAAEVVLFQDHGNRVWRSQLARDDIPVQTLDGTFRGLAKALRARRPFLLHTHGYKAGLLGRPAARLARVPVVSTFHTGARERLPVGLYDLADEWTSFLGKRIVVSRDIQARVPYPAALIPSFVPASAEPKRAASPRRIAFVGRLREEKQPQHFCELARRSRADLEWHVYGDGPMRSALERDYGQYAHFHGAVSDMDAVWQSTGLLVMTSRFEGLPLVALEALAAGVPVLASRVGGLPTVIEHGVTGWLYPDGDLEAAEQLIATWLSLDTTSLQRLRRAGWQHVMDNFSEPALLPKIIDVYRSAGACLPTTGTHPVPSRA